MPIQNIGSDIIKAYLAGIQRRQQRESEARHYELQTKAAEEKVKEFKASLDQAQEHFNKTLELHKASAALEKVKALTSIQTDAAQTGLQIPGSTETQSPTTSTQQDFEALNQGTPTLPRIISPPIPEEFNNHESPTNSFVTGGQQNQVRPSIQPPRINRNITLPTGDQLTLPDPNTYARQQAERTRITQAPKIEGAIQQAIGISEGRLPGLLKLETVKEAADIAKEKQKQTAAKILQTQRDIAAGQRSGSRDAAMVEAARIKAKATLANKNAAQAEKDEALKVIADDFKDGSATVEEMPKGDAGLKLRGMLASEGYRPINKKDKETLEGLGIIRQVYSKYQELNEAYKSTGFISAVNPQVRNLEQQADALLGNMARVYGGEKGVLTQKDIERIAGTRPTKVQGILNAAGNEERLKDFMSFYRDKVNLTKGTLKPAQSKAINERFNLIIPIEKVGRNKDGTRSRIVSYDNGASFVEAAGEK